MCMGEQRWRIYFWCEPFTAEQFVQPKSGGGYNQKILYDNYFFENLDKIKCFQVQTKNGLFAIVCILVCVYVWRHVHVKEDAYRNWKRMTDHLKPKFQESLSHLNLMLRTNVRFCKSSMGSYQMNQLFSPINILVYFLSSQSVYT